MEIKKSTSTEPFDYEILIRKVGINQYSAYCPQLNYLIKGTEHEEVRNKMARFIDEHIEKIKKTQVE